MKAIIRDVDVLNAIEPPQVVTYLQANGWHEYSNNDLASTWTDSGEKLEVLLPLKPEFTDFHRRMRDVLEILEYAEDRSQLEIISDIINYDADAIALRVPPRIADKGRIPLATHIELIQSLRDTFLWAACATINRLAYFREPPSEALAYLGQLRLGFSPQYPACFVTILSPIDSGYSNGNIPFSRQVVNSWVQALEAIALAATQSLSTGNLSSFVGTEEQGVSANLCAAIARIYDIIGNSSIEIDLTWSPIFPVEKPRQIIIPDRALRAIASIASLGNNFQENWQQELHKELV
ncbi:MAG: hypothetical protein AB4352_11850 [Hormoscilla sp.]